MRIDLRLLGLLKGCFRIAQELLRDCSGSLSKRFAAVLEHLWSRFGPSWTILGASWSVFGGVFRALWKRLEGSWKRPGAWFFKIVKINEKSRFSATGKQLIFQ